MWFKFESFIPVVCTARKLHFIYARGTVPQASYDSWCSLLPDLIFMSSTTAINGNKRQSVKQVLQQLPFRVAPA
jgi:hypothetical protein